MLEPSPDRSKQLNDTPRLVTGQVISPGWRLHKEEWTYGNEAWFSQKGYQKIGSKKSCPDRHDDSRKTAESYCNISPTFRQ
jgi:hypothetical protein